MSDLCPVYAPFFGAMGCTAAIVFTCFGAAYGTAKSGVGIAAMGVLRPDLIVKNIVPVIMAGIIGIYGLVVSVLISDNLGQKDYALFTGFIQLGAGLAVGLAGLAAGFAIGIVGDAGVRGTAQQPRLFVGMILILIFAEVLGTTFSGPIYTARRIQANLDSRSNAHVRSQADSGQERASTTAETSKGGPILSRLQSQFNNLIWGTRHEGTRIKR
ncbi:uncharacterized protein E0L32_008354 [Thyridium curvatum]|uniref:V-type proton ATPase proteolipid subunit n=1 Tax=Thyridium curvatum TaxID=1093900 RepID=A0A507AK45_9PEZI|nr:uncharacterized protein E0L32_008354 [Thyridium curvatum]TPX10785.1 hypothetical protein E0L32_008354 [Thyridium curvatum]